jgi:hypothetical protein
MTAKPERPSASRGQALPIAPKGQLPSGFSSKNSLGRSDKTFTTTLVIDLEAARRRVRPPEAKVPPIVRQVAQAEQFQCLLDARDARCRADLARRFGLTRARVTQLLNLLELQPEIVAYVRGLPPGTPARFITEKMLRPFTQLPAAAQLQAAEELLPGFSAYIARSAVS